MPDEEQSPNPEPAPAEPASPEATPFETPKVEKVEKGIQGPWEQRSEDD